MQMRLRDVGTKALFIGKMPSVFSKGSDQNSWSTSPTEE